MEEFTRENGLTITCMEREPIPGATDVNMRVTTWTIRNMARERTSGRTVAHTRAAGRMASRTGEASTNSSMGGCVKVSGKRASARTGKMKLERTDNLHSLRRRLLGRRRRLQGQTHIRTTQDDERRLQLLIIRGWD